MNPAETARAKRSQRTGERPRVLITNAEERSMLAVCRGLHAAGYAVTAASATALAAAKWSRSCSRRLSLIDARDSSSLFTQQLREELTRYRYATLIAGSDSALLAVSRTRSQLEGLTTLGLPAHRIVERALRRETLTKAAEQVGMPTPTSVRCTDAEQALRSAEQLGWPVAIKSIEAAAQTVESVASVPKGQIVGDGSELAAVASLYDGGFILQRVIAGELVSLGGVFADGRLLAVAASRYERMWPPQSGSVTFSTTIVPPSDLLNEVSRLMTVIGWEGMFELELIHADGGRFVPIDLNPRPYGSMALAGAAGAPPAAVWCDWLLGRSGEAGSEPPWNGSALIARAGVRYRWEDGELRHMARQLRDGHRRAALELLRPHRGVVHAHFSLGDPLPLLARGAHLAQRALSGR